MKANIVRAFAALVAITLIVAPVSARGLAATSGADAPPGLEYVGAPNVSRVADSSRTGVIGEVKGSTEPAYYIVQLVDAPLALYQGGVAGLGATSPRATGERKLNARSAASTAYRSYLAGKQNDLVASIERAVGHTVDVRYRYFAAFNGLAVRLTPQEAAAVVGLPGVRQVQRNEARYLLTDAGPAWIGAPGIWDGTTTGGLPGTMGEGVIVGVIDTGINTDHPSFADIGGDGYDHTNPFGAGNYVGWCEPGFPILIACNDKLIGTWSYPDSGNDPEDDDDHGSHTASTTAGNVVDATLVAPTITVEDTISGVAPHANIIAYDVCTPEPEPTGACFTTAILAAIDQTVLDGVDVINYSISGGNDPYSDSVSQAFLGAVGAGVFVSASAGNSGPGAGTNGHSEPWVQTVGASTHNRKFVNALIDMSGGDPPVPGDMTGVSLTSGYGPAPIVYAGDFGDPLCPLGEFPAGTWTSGEIVVCDRGIYARVDKAQSVLDGGAGGFVLANDLANGTSLVADGYVLPGVHIIYDDGVTLKAWLASGAGHMASIAGTTADFDPTNGDVMAAFSSRGPSGSLPDIIKPDVTAPGVDVWAAFANGSTTPPEYGLLSGTSMSSPHSAGSAALIRALHPDWTPAEVKSALMSTGLTATVLKEDGVTSADPFDMGAGRIDLSMAGPAGLVLDETEADYAAADPASGGDPTTLNLASLADGSCAVACGWTRTVTNELATDTSWTVSTSAPAGLILTASPATFTIPAGGSQDITVTADVSALPAGDWAFARVNLTEDAGLASDVHFPVAVLPVSGVVPDLVEISTRRNAGSQLVEGLESAFEITDLTIDVFGLTQATLATESLSQDPTNGDPYDNLNDGTTFYILEDVPAGARRLLAEITASDAVDIDLYVGQDLDADGPEASEEVCVSATGAVLEYCDLPNPDPGSYWVLVQNWDESNTPPDDVTLATAVVPGSDTGNMTVEGPASVPASTPFDVTVFWDTPTMVAGDRWYGVFDIGTDPGNPGNVGTVPVNIIRFEDDVAKEVSSPTAMEGDTLTYTITVQPNVTPEDLAYTLTDTIPAGLTYVPGSASASTGTVEVVGNVVTWTGVMPAAGFTYNVTTSDSDAFCAAPLSEFDGEVDAYVNLEAFGIPTNPAVFGDTVWYTVDFLGGEFSFFGADQGEIWNFTDDGFTFFDPSTPGITPWVNQDIPDPAEPNNLQAIFWRDLEIVYDGGTNRGVSLADLTSGGIPVAAIIEYDDVEDWPAGANPTYDFEVVGFYDVDDSPGAYEYIFAYDNLTGDVTLGTIGLENVDGSQAVQYGYNDLALSDGMAICFDFAATSSDAAVITYDVTVDVGASGILTNDVVHNTDNPGSMPASTSVDVEIVGGEVIVDDTSYSIEYDGWTGAEDPSAYGGGYRAASLIEGITHSTLEASDAVTLITYRGPDQGKARVLIDNVDKGVVDLYAPAPEYQHEVSFGGLSLGQHTIRVIALGKKNPASSGTEVRVDGILVNVTTTDDNHPSVRYDHWDGRVDLGAYNGSARTTGLKDQSVFFSFTGTQFTWISARCAGCGRAKVIVDGVSQGNVDLYNATFELQYAVVIGGLTDAAHDVEIRALGTHNPASAGNRIYFDAYSVP